MTPLEILLKEYREDSESSGRPVPFMRANYYCTTRRVEADTIEAFLCWEGHNWGVAKSFHQMRGASSPVTAHSEYLFCKSIVRNDFSERDQSRYFFLARRP
jgi:hypothetical protein